MPKFIYEKDKMDQAISMIIDDGQKLMEVAQATDIPVQSIYSELRRRGLAIRREVQYNLCSNTTLLYRLLESLNEPLNFHPQALDWIENAEQFKYSVEAYNKAKEADESEAEIKLSNRLLEMYKSKADIGTGRLIWSELCRYIAKSVSYQTIIKKLDDMTMYYSEDDIQAFSATFDEFMNAYHKKWVRTSDKEIGMPTDGESRILNMYDEIGVRSDGVEVHLWTQREIAYELGLSQTTVANCIRKWRK